MRNPAPDNMVYDRVVSPTASVTAAVSSCEYANWPSSFARFRRRGVAFSVRSELLDMRALTPRIVGAVYDRPRYRTLRAVVDRPYNCPNHLGLNTTRFINS